MKNKKGQMGMMIALIAAMAFLLVFGVVWLIMDSIQNELNQSEIYDQNPTATAIGDDFDRLLTTGSYIFVTIIVSIAIGLMLSGYMLKANPVFIIGGIMLMIIITILAVPFANVYDDISGDADLKVSSDKFTVMSTLMSKLPQIIIFLSLFFFAALYFKVGAG